MFRLLQAQLLNNYALSILYVRLGIQVWTFLKIIVLELVHSEQHGKAFPMEPPWLPSGASDIAVVSGYLKSSRWYIGSCFL